jgi:hypothetical protein
MDVHRLDRHCGDGFKKTLETDAATLRQASGGADNVVVIPAAVRNLIKICCQNPRRNATSCGEINLLRRPRSPSPV